MARRRATRCGSLPLVGRPSELAALVFGCREDAESLPVLADWLEERLGLAATGTLLRQPGLGTHPLEQLTSPSGCDTFALGPDVTLWIIEASFGFALHPYDEKSMALVGLYAHPP